MKNNRGFTLVELLAVIVILAVVMTIAVTAVGPLMSKSRKGALGTEGLNLIEAAQLAYQSGQMGAGIGSTDTVCFTLDYLNYEGYFPKKYEAGKYNGSVLVKYVSDGNYEYTYWITNGQYTYMAQPNKETDISNAADYNSSDVLDTCGGATVAKTCKNVSGTYKCQ